MARSEFVEVLDSIQRKVKSFRDYYERNEAAVREQLFVPILRALGWNPEDPNEVQPGVSTEEGIPDYTLTKGGKKLFVEIKKLSIDVEDKKSMRQLARYSFSEGTKFGVLTNGVVWILLKSFEEGTTLKERIVWKVDIENEDLNSVTRKLNTISRDNIEQIDTLIKKYQILDEVWDSLLDEPKDLIKAIIPVFHPLLAESYPDYDFQDVEIGEQILEKIHEFTLLGKAPVLPEEEEGLGPGPGPKGIPRSMHIRGEYFAIHNAYEILVNTAEWLIKRGKLKTSDAPIAMGYKRYLIHREPKHRYGDTFRGTRKLSNGLYIETSLSTAGCINHSRSLLERYGFPKDDLKIEFA